MLARLVGAKFRPNDAKAVVRGLEEGDSVALVPEPTNIHDPNAIRVEYEGLHLGYIQREVAAQLPSPPRTAKVSVRLDPLSVLLEVDDV